MDPNILAFLKIVGYGEPLVFKDMSFNTFIDTPETALVAMGLGFDFAQLKTMLASEAKLHRTPNLAIRKLRDHPAFVQARMKAGLNVGQSRVCRTPGVKRSCFSGRKTVYNPQAHQRPKSPEVYHTQVPLLEHMTYTSGEHDKRKQSRFLQQDKIRPARPASPEVYHTEAVPFEKICVVSSVDKLGERCCGSAHGSHSHYA